MPTDFRMHAKPVSFVSGTRPLMTFSDEQKDAVRELTWRVSKTFYETLLRQTAGMMTINTSPSEPLTCWARLTTPNYFHWQA